MVLSIKKGRLRQETHYYPYGLPIMGLGGEDLGEMANRKKYQGNEIITESGLNWMSFGARQYASPVAKLYGNPQLGRFLSVDPLAGGSQAALSPYHAMGHDPVLFVDPGGTRYGVHPETFQEAGHGSVGNGWEGITETFQAAMACGFDQINGFIYYFDLTMQLKMQKVMQEKFHDKTVSEWNGMLALHNLMGGVEVGIPGSSGSEKEGEGDDDKGNGDDGNKGSSNDGTWYGMTTSTQTSGHTFTFFDSEMGDKLTVTPTHSIHIAGEEGKYYNINIGLDTKGSLNSLSVNNFGLKMTINLAHFGVSGGFSFFGYHSTLGFQFNHGFNFTGSFGHAQGKFDNSFNFSFRPGLYTGAAVILGGVSIFQPGIPAAVVPIFSF